MNKIVVLFLDVENAKDPEVIEIDNDNLNEFKRLIGCEHIDVTRRSFGGKKFCIVCDDVGALKLNKKLSCYAYNHFQRIYGNVIIACEKGKDLDSISKIDLVRLNSCVAQYHTDKVYKVLKIDS